MIVAHAKQAQDEQVVRAAVSGREWPVDIKGYTIRFDEDSTGDPAVRIELLVEDDWHPSKEKILRLERFRRSIEAELIDAGLDHWPYVGFETIEPADR